MIHTLYNTPSGTTLGSYDATDADHAADLLAQDEGFDSFAEAVADGALDPDEMVITAGGRALYWHGTGWMERGRDDYHRHDAMGA